MSKLKEITINSWVVFEDDEITIVGLLCENEDNIILSSPANGVVKFEDWDKVNAHFDTDIRKNMINKVKLETSTVHGWDVVGPAFEVEQVKGLPVYVRSESSNVHYVAGYYCLNFPRGWQPAHNPKFETLSKYGYVGPYRTENEMKMVIGQVKRGELTGSKI